MNKDKILKLLDIDDIIDVKQIKKAYARKSKTIHPEEKPEEFSKLHKAYKEALVIVKSNSKNQSILIQDEIKETSSNDYILEVLMKKKPNKDNLQEDLTKEMKNEVDVKEILKNFDEQEEQLQAEFLSNLKKIRLKQVRDINKEWETLLYSNYFWLNKNNSCFIEKFLEQLVEFDGIELHILQRLYKIYSFSNKKEIEYGSAENRMYLFLDNHIKFGYVTHTYNNKKIQKINPQEFQKHVKFFEKYNYTKAALSLQKKEGTLFMLGYKQYQYFLNDCVYLLGEYITLSQIRMALHHYPKKYSYKLVKYYIEDKEIRRIMMKARIKRKKGYYFVILHNYFFTEPEPIKRTFKEKVKLFLKQVKAK